MSTTAASKGRVFYRGTVQTFVSVGLFVLDRSFSMFNKYLYLNLDGQSVLSKATNTKILRSSICLLHQNMLLYKVFGNSWRNSMYVVGEPPLGLLYYIPKAFYISHIEVFL